MYSQLRTKIVIPLILALGTLLVVVGLLGPAMGASPLTATPSQLTEAPTPTPTPVSGEGTNGDHEPGVG